jgi:rRNA pseudouridine-1189 N-methylase Emg1 (Nep1/Mra1 family)
MLAHRVAEHFDIAHRGLLGGTKSLQNEENKLDLGRWTRLGYLVRVNIPAC